MQTGPLVRWGGGSRQLPLGLELVEGSLCSPGVLIHAAVFILVSSPLSRAFLPSHHQGLGTSTVPARRPRSDDALTAGMPGLPCS